MRDPIEIQLRRIADALEASARNSAFQVSVLESLDGLRRQGEKIMALLDDLEAKVTRIKTVQDSAIALLNGLSAQIKAAGNDPVKLAALTAALDTDATDLATAVSANTPAV
jgi:hypothetical protein